MLSWGVCLQKLLVGDFPHELEMEEMEEDVPKRKNRTKGRVCLKKQTNKGKIPSTTQHYAHGVKREPHTFLTQTVIHRALIR